MKIEKNLIFTFPEDMPLLRYGTKGSLLKKNSVYNDNHAGTKMKVFNVVEIRKQKWVYFETPDYDMLCPWACKLEDLQDILSPITDYELY